MINHLMLHVLGAAHVLTAILALLAGALVLLQNKGTRRHVWTGRVYLGAMLATNLTALGIYELFARFGPFHVFALLSLLSVLAGVVPVWRRKAGWMERHAQWVLGSYVGLCSAAVAEISSHLLAFPFGPTVIISSAIVLITGWVWMWVFLTRRFSAP